MKSQYSVIRDAMCQCGNAYVKSLPESMQEVVCPVSEWLSHTPWNLVAKEMAEMINCSGFELRVSEEDLCGMTFEDNLSVGSWQTEVEPLTKCGCYTFSDECWKDWIVCPYCGGKFDAKKEKDCHGIIE